METRSTGGFDWRFVLGAAAVLAVGIALRQLIGEWITLAISAVAAAVVMVTGQEWERRYLVTAMAALGAVFVIMLIAAGLSAL